MFGVVVVVVVVCVCVICVFIYVWWACGDCCGGGGVCV